MVDDEDPVAEPLDVAHVVRRQQQGRAALAPLGDEELAQPLLREHVETDRRLVQDEQLRGVQERGRDLGPHPLAERERAHRRAERGPISSLLDAGRAGTGARSGERGGSPRGCANESRSGRSHQSWRALAEDDADAAGDLDPLAHGVQPTRAHVPAVGLRIPVSILIVVDLPAPLAPM